MAVALRKAVPADHDWVQSVVDQWWGRQVSRSVPRLFLDHFFETSLVAETDGCPVGFLIGLLSPSQKQVAYVHFVGVDPDSRGQSVGRLLYEAFFDLARSDGRTEVSAITSPGNTGSIAFHRRMGFDVSEPTEGLSQSGLTHVRFTRRL